MSDSPRYREFSRADLDAEQQAVFDRVGAARAGAVPAPFHIFLESPELAQLAGGLGAFCRYRTGLAPRLSELAVLVTAAHWQAAYEFTVHVSEARKAGVPDGVIDAIGAGLPPAFDDDEARLVYEFASTFYRSRDIPDALFEQAIARFGRRTVVELASVLGYYSFLAIVLKVFRVPGIQPPT